MKSNITLIPVKKEELPEFERRIQEAFLAAAEENFGEQEEPIPSHQELEECRHNLGTVIFHLMQGSCKVGGVVLNINSETQHNSLEFFFIAVEYQNRGLGQAAWRAIEKAYPKTKIWSTVTPYFEKRNIHFYVNRCGFHIVKFWNAYYAAPNIFSESQGTEQFIDKDETFYFEKIMKDKCISNNRK